MLNDMNVLRKTLASLAIFGLLSGCAQAQPVVYYVDYSSGEDTRSGLTKVDAWQHAPGDPNARGQAARTPLRGGDTVRFHGGVAYRGSIRLSRGGETGAPVRYVGDEWNDGADITPAVFDGSDSVENVTRCVSAAACDNVPGWEHLSLVRFNISETALVKFFDKQGALYESQYPTPPDPFFSDDIESYAPMSVGKAGAAEGGELKWPDAVKRLSGGLNGAKLSIWVQQNQVVQREIAGVRGDLLVFKADGVKPYTDRDGRYAVIGSPALIDRPGQYAVVAAGKALVWLRGTALTVGNGRAAIDLAGQSHVIVRGFIFQHFAAAAGANRQGLSVQNTGGLSRDIMIEKNRFQSSALYNGQGVITLRNVENLRIIDNVIEGIERGSGIRMGASRDVIIENNHFSRIGRTAIALLGVTNAVVRGNWLNQLYGVHGNGISLYLANRNVTVEANSITRTTRPMTFHGDKSQKADGDHHFVITRNIMIADGDSAALISWGANTRNVRITGNLLIGDKTGIRLNASDTGVVVKGNLLNGIVFVGGQNAGAEVRDNHQIGFDGAAFAAKIEAGPAQVALCKQLGTGRIGADLRC